MTNTKKSQHFVNRMPHMIYISVWSLVTSCSEVQNFAEEEQNIEVIEEPAVQPGKDS